ncbi:MAG: efflux RND transporter periplasmic adaptor subunit [Alphaproteobacteria bacterium]|nr:efflux RND transporter periplasmic adaptor subunit [Alphaproteobacteria bacterium]
MSEDNDNISHSPVRRSYVVAVVIFLLLAAWVASGELNRLEELAQAVMPQSQTKQSTPAKPAAPPAKQSAAPAPAGAQATGNTAAAAIPTVRVRTITAAARQQDVIVRGRTEALRKVTVRAETAGKVAAIRADKGAAVKKGDTICELNVDARRAMLEQARATMTQRKLEYEASKTLQEKGFRSETSVAGDLAAYQASKAEVERMEKEFENTKIKAPFDGVVDDRMVDVGDYLAPGQPCALVVALDPFLIVGRVSEKDVHFIQIGHSGWAKLVTGERVEGKVRFVAKSSDNATRTFRVELEVPNSEGRLRDGITAEMHIAAATVDAHRITPAILALDDRGQLGVRIIDEQRRVRFVRVTIIGDGPDGVWVVGLPRTVTIITVGQEYVTEGQQVNIVVDQGSAT